MIKRPQKVGLPLVVTVTVCVMGVIMVSVNRVGERQSVEQVKIARSGETATKNEGKQPQTFGEVWSANNPTTSPLPPITTAKKLRRVEEFYPTDKDRAGPNHQRPTYTDVLTNPSFWIGKAASGDPSAAFVVSELVAGCTSFAGEDSPFRDAASAQSEIQFSTDCSSIRREDVADRVKWLEVAAAKGDVPSQLAYAEHAFAVISSNKAIGSQTDRVELMSSKSLQFLESASRAGVLEAYMYLFAGHSKGYFGHRDDVAAYSYLLAWSYLDDAFPLSRLTTSFAADRLRPHEIEAAQTSARKIAASCCDR